MQAGTDEGVAAERRLRVHRWWAVSIVWTAVAWVVVPRTLQSLTAPKYRASVGMPAPDYSAVASLSQTLLMLALLGLCALVLVDTVRDEHTARVLPLLLLLAPWAYLVMRDTFVGSMPGIQTLVYPMLVAALWRLRLKLDVLAPLGYAVAGAAFLSLVLGVVLPSKGVFTTDMGAMVMEDKVFLPWGILVGFFTHGNSLGQFLVLGLPAVLLVRRRGMRAALLGVVLLALVWSTSRTSYLALVLVVLAGLALLALPRTLRPAGGFAVAAVSMLGVAVLPFAVTDPGALASRGFIWAASIDAWSGSWLVGLGSDWYSRVGSTSARLASTVWHAHNQVLQLLVAGGVVLAGLTVLLMFLVCLRAAQMADRSLFGVLYVVALAASSATEVTFMFVTNMAVLPVVVIPLAVILLAETGPDTGEAGEPGFDPGAVARRGTLEPGRPGGEGPGARHQADGVGGVRR